MKHNDIVDMIEQLNYEAYDQMIDDGETYYPFEYCSVGYDHLIKFFHITIWHSEDDKREYTDEDEYEPLEQYIRREASRLSKKIGKLSFNKE